MTPSASRILVLAYGNPGRLDDGLGPAAGEALQARNLEGITVETDLQLQVEDALGISQHDVVVFVDATVSGPSPFSCHRIEPSDAGPSFSTHSVTPEALLGLARSHFGATTEAWVVAIRGYEFDEFGERLSENARANLDAAVDFLASCSQERRFREFEAGDVRACAPTV